jgi:ABC-type anion transport system duplicated permease subunit
MRGRGSSLFTILWIIVGVIVAADHKYLKNIDDVESVLSAILAILLWPLVLLDVNLRIN